MELAVTTPVMSQRLETRRNMTTGHSTTRHSNADDAAERLLIVLVGLPARGKSFIARKLWNYLVWRSNQCRIFNVGKYRRQLATTDSEEPNVQKADFFDDNNKTAAKLRQEAARLALKATLEWLNESSIENNNGDDDDNESGDKQIPLSYSARRVYHRVAIFDATNSSRARREWILQECAKSDKETGRTTGVLFLESICDDRELLEENFQVKISSSPDFDHMTKEEALEDLRARIATYESRYETIDIVDPTHPISFIKIFNLSSRLMVNHIYGRLAKVVLPAIMAWNTGSRPIYLCRAGETKAMEEYVKQSSHNNGLSSPFMKVKRKRSDPLGGRGYQFRDALGDFIEQEGLQFMKTNHPSVHTGTSIAGLYEESSKGQNEADASTDGNTVEHTPAKLPFPCLVMSSTMPRAVETATWEKHPFPIKDVTNLNPLDMGDFSGMDLASIQEEDSEWYEQLKKDPFHTRYVNTNVSLFTFGVLRMECWSCVSHITNVFGSTA